jgi:phosphoadenosine phosphosulfate reductase
LSSPSDAAPAAPAGALDDAAVAALGAELAGKSPAEVVKRVLAQYGARAAISFSGAEDVMLIDLAAKSGHPFSVFSLDTGRLHAETYRFIERVRKHYGIEISVTAPDVVEVEALVRKKGFFSFYDDGHHECCGIRKVGPLRRVLTRYDAWITGQRRDQSPTRADVALVQLDTNQGANGRILKLNPLAEQSLGDVWSYIRDEQVPYNALHDQGFISIGCEPCTRPPRPGEHERAGRWWWEDSTKRECGLHLPK